MNAISRPTPQATDAARTERHLRMCQRLAELGMELAEAAAARAHTELTTPPDPDQPAGPDPVLVFTRLSYAVRQAIALEARIAAGAITARQSTPCPPDPRRLKLRAAIANATHDAVLRLELNERLDCELASDPGRLIPLQTILEAIAEEYDLDLEDLDHTPGLDSLDLRPFETG